MYIEHITNVKYLQYEFHMMGGGNVYEKFAELLETNHKTASQVSRDTGIAENIFSYWKSGRSKPKVDKLLILARYFGVPIETFIEGAQEDAPCQK